MKKERNYDIIEFMEIRNKADYIKNKLIHGLNSINKNNVYLFITRPVYLTTTTPTTNYYFSIKAKIYSVKSYTIGQIANRYKVDHNLMVSTSPYHYMDGFDQTRLYAMLDTIECDVVINYDITDEEINDIVNSIHKRALDIIDKSHNYINERRIQNEYSKKRDQHAVDCWTFSK